MSQGQSSDAKPMLAVITPTYNRADRVRNLHQRLLDLGRQSNWIHVIVDDCSPHAVDFSGCGFSEDKLILHRRSLNGGPLAARNDAIDIAMDKGADIFAFIDDDDLPAANFFPYVQRMWDQNTGIGWFVSRCKFVGKYIPENAEAQLDDGVYNFIDESLVGSRLSCDLVHVLTRDRLGRLRFSRYGRTQREWTLFLKLAQNGPFYFSNEQTKIVEYLDSGLTLGVGDTYSDIHACLNYFLRAYCLLLVRPLNVRCLKNFIIQSIRVPQRIAAYYYHSAVGAKQDKQ